MAICANWLHFASKILAESDWQLGWSCHTIPIHRSVLFHLRTLDLIAFSHGLFA
jgi:hypothetical protein